MSVHYTEDFKKEVVKAYMAGDKSIPQRIIVLMIQRGLLWK